MAKHTSSLVTSFKSDELGKGLFFIDVANLPDTFIASPKNQSTNIEKIDKSLTIENIVKSPMVGVAYLSVDPSTPPYVKVGQHVKQGETLLLIEAMKTFNQVKAPKSGIVKKIIVLNSQPVEFGDDLLIFE